MLNIVKVLIFYIYDVKSKQELDYLLSLISENVEIMREISKLLEELYENRDDKIIEEKKRKIKLKVLDILDKIKPEVDLLKTFLKIHRNEKLDEIIERLDIIIEIDEKYLEDTLNIFREYRNASQLMRTVKGLLVFENLNNKVFTWLSKIYNNLFILVKSLYQLYIYSSHKSFYKMYQNKNLNQYTKDIIIDKLIRKYTLPRIPHPAIISNNTSVILKVIKYLWELDEDIKDEDYVLKFIVPLKYFL